MNRYLVAVAATAVAVLLRWLADPWLGEYLLFTPLFGAIAVAVWIGGWRPALVAVVLGLLAYNYLFIEPRGSFFIQHVSDFVALFLYLLTCSIIVGFGEGMRIAQRRTEEGRERLRITQASIGDAVIVTDTQGRVTTMNPVAESLTGWTQNDAEGHPLDAVFHIVNEHSREPVENPAKRALREGVIVGLANHTILIAKNGTQRPIDDSAAPIRDGRGIVSGCVLVFRDVTAKRDAEELLRKQQAEIRERLDELQAIYETAPVGLCSIDRDLRYVRINSRLAEINGLPVKDHIGKSIHEVIPDLAAKIEPALRRILETGEPVIETELQGERPPQPGVIGTWLESWYPLRDADGKIIGLNKVVLDITDRKRDEVRIYDLLRELKESDRRKDEFLAILAHELRGPLAPLRNMLEVIKQAEADAGVLRQARDTMDRQLGQLVRLVDDLLDVSRITHDRLELRTARVELVSILYQAVEVCRPLAERANQEFQVKLPEQQIYLHADAVRLTQVFSNLLNNACKYTEPGGKIWLTGERQGSDVAVSVKDSGIGIPADKLSSIFEMFTQVDRSLERSQGGLGIGLTLVKRLVEMHGGTVEAASDGEGKGSEFVVRLPILIENPQTVAVEPPARPMTLNRRILVVDDNRDSATSLAMLLKMTGNETYTAHDGLEALQAAETFLPEVILLDIGLPKLNGREVCRRIRQQPWGRDMLLIAMTGWGQDEDRRKSQDAGFDYHVIKPVDLTGLIKLLAGSRSPNP
jgi:PAS domain S-box-containing protein